MTENKLATQNIIHLKGMEFYAYHGVLEEEKTLGQRFVIDLDLYPRKWITQFDNLQDTINYAEVFTLVKDCVQNKRFKLLESLAEYIATRILDNFDCSQVRVEVHKPNAPIPGILKDVSIEIIRERKA
jgi:dihydroneopterin aldolase